MLWVVQYNGPTAAAAVFIAATATTPRPPLPPAPSHTTLLPLLRTHRQKGEMKEGRK